MLRDANDLGYPVAQSAIAADTGSIDFFLSPKAESSNSLNANFRKGSEKITVPVTTIDRYISLGAPVPTIMKIDVETLEPEVLAGSRKTVANHKPIITCELLPRADSRDGIGELMAWLQYYGYRFYQITETGPFGEYSASEVIGALDSHLRDWILSPEPLSKAYYDSLSLWREAMNTSDVDTNLFIEPGDPVFEDLQKHW
ncbi:MAG: FkbM family methyltransferase [Hyphomonadaceae bacterium]